jgi:hypothetical protein
MFFCRTHFKTKHFTYAIHKTHACSFTPFTKPPHLSLAKSWFTRSEQTNCEDRVKRLENISDGTRASCHPDACALHTNESPALKPFYSQEPLKDRKLVSWDNKSVRFLFCCLLWTKGNTHKYLVMLPSKCQPFDSKADALNHQHHRRYFLRKRTTNC